MENKIKIMENKSAWYNDDVLPKDMINAATGKKWGFLEDSQHFKVLDSFIKELDFKNIADVGCGPGDLGRLYNNINYTGFDLEHIIEKVAKEVNPNLNYKYFDLNYDDYSEFKGFDLIICNGVLSEIKNPINIISKILKNTDKYFLIHRQFFSSENSSLTYNTYGDLPTNREIISLLEFKDLMINHKIEKQITNEWGDTVLIKRK